MPSVYNDHLCSADTIEAGDGQDDISEKNETNDRSLIVSEGESYEVYVNGEMTGDAITKDDIARKTYESSEQHHVHACTEKDDELTGGVGNYTEKLEMI